MKYRKSVIVVNAVLKRLNLVPFYTAPRFRHRLFKGSLLSQRFYQGEVLSKAERYALSDLIDVWRDRLMSMLR